MDQVSRPMQIALVALVLLAGAWFTVLRPKSDTSSGSTPAAAPVAPGVKGLTSAVAKAKGASDASDAANARLQKAAAAVDGSTPPATAGKGTTVAPVAAGKTAATAGKPDTSPDPSRKLLASLRHGKTVVLMFSGRGADDRAARKALRRLAATDKRVVAKIAPVSKVGAYEAITTGVQVLTSPTILVIGRNRKAVSVTGYTDATVLRQMVGDARRAHAKK